MNQQKLGVNKWTEFMWFRTCQLLRVGQVKELHKRNFVIYRATGKR
jgi:hypothetical protein